MTVYPWISEAFQIIQPILPCSKNDAVAKLVEMMPQRAVDTALRLRSTSRVTAANRALQHLIGVRVTLKNDMLNEKKIYRSLIGPGLLQKLNAAGSSAESETGFTSSSANTYRKFLKQLNWIEVIGTEWKWIGPEDAEWSTVSTANKRRRSP